MWEIIVVFLAACGLVALCASAYAALVFGRNCKLRATIKINDTSASAENALRASAILVSLFGPELEVEIEYPNGKGDNPLGL